MDRPTRLAEAAAINTATVVRDSGVKMTWLCEKTGIPRTTMARRLDGLAPFTVAELDAIAGALRVNPFDLLTPPTTEQAGAPTQREPVAS